ncbi:lycopene cyclase family protein [Pseudonocardia sp. RS11V-5]|uniref:lycopene cyclase family protein n=1 Tax=Pseudonocardia terrae TaxID=2905831 RepID=UPI001E30C600|nr:lycopene cyclase family protein [Pseudonocardia terrae]MCE3550018.1 lycopene cyclase family protein [Pseudonocardia terrae]
MDVLVAGGGPAGRALAGACVRLGLRTALADPAPDRPWRATYAAWAGELPADLPADVVAARAQGRAVALTEHRLGWEYTILDTAALRAHLDAGLAGVAVHRAKVVGSEPGYARLAGGRVPARLVVDATGHRPARARRPVAEQTAYGLIVDEAVAAPLVAPGEALFMDWRQEHGRTGGAWPTFLYAVPLGGGRVLVEETSLARRPGLPLPELRARLQARLAHRGVPPPADAGDERVRFPVEGPVGATLAPGPAFGAAGALVHPATGFSVATALRLAPQLAEALAGPAPRRAARSVVWPAQARAVHVLRHRGLEALLRMPPERVPAFFEAFLGLPAHHRWAYLTGRADLPGTAAAMRALWARADWSLRARLVGPALLPRARPATTG